MVRKVFLYLIIAFAIGGTGYLAYRFFNKITHPPVDIMDAIPGSASIVIRINDPMEFWKKLSGANLMWHDLKSIEPLRSMHLAGKEADSLSAGNKRFAAFVYGKPLAISLHSSGVAASDILFVMEQGETSNESVLSMIMDCVGETAEPDKRKFKTDYIYSIKMAEGNYYLLIKNGFVTLSSSPTLSESVAAHIEEGSSITQEAGWTQIYGTTSKEADANIFVHHQNFGTLMAGWLNSEMKESLAATNPFALFSGLDIDVSSAAISLNGFSSVSDSSEYFLGIFRDHDPQSFTAAKILPENTAGFVWMGINDGESFYTSMERWLQFSGQIKEHNEIINSFNAEFDCNIRKSILSWIGSELVLFSNASGSDDLNTHLFLAVKINELNDPIASLNELQSKLDSSSAPAESLNGIEIRQLKGDHLFSMLFGDLFKNLNQPYYFRIEDFVVFGNSLTEIENYFGDISSDKILGKDITYYNFVSENLSDKANLTVYANPSRISLLVKSMVEEGRALTLEDQSSFLSKFDAFAWQMNNKGKGLFYNTLYLKYNPSGREDSKSLWELALDTVALQQPFLLHNHITGSGAVFIQDENYAVYFISSQGEILWKKQLEEKIAGKVDQLDYFGNGKLQIFFCTQTQLHLIDLKGNDMQGFPIHLNADVTGNPVVFDYENNQNHRFLIPCGKQIINLDKEGKKTTGWEFSGTEEIIRESPVFFRCDNKDYLFVNDEGGNLYFIDRKGKSRYSANITLGERTTNNIVLEPGRAIENTAVVYSDSSGKFNRIFLSGNKDSSGVTRHSRNHRFAMADLNDDKQEDLIVLDSNTVFLYQWNGKKIGTFAFTERVRNEIYVFRQKDGTVYLGFCSPDAGEIYLVQANGNLHSRFPLNGSTAFMLNDINSDGSLEIVVGTGSRRIICYSFN